MYVALAGVTALFRREIPPFQKYVLSSRVVAWDQKWVFVVSHFVSDTKGKDGNRTLFASCLSKYVFKSGRRTVAPEIVFAESGLLPERPAGVEPLASGGASGVETPMVGLREGKMGEETVEIAVERIRRAVHMGDEAVARDAEKVGGGEAVGYWTWERVEAERKRGMELASHMMGLDGLAEEFREGDEEGFEKIGEFFGGW